MTVTVLGCCDSVSDGGFCTCEEDMMTDELETASDLLADDDPENIYPDVLAFVVNYLAPLYARQWQAGREPRWCARWWEHPEAVVRLTTLWLAWEAARLQPGGVLGWFRDADANMDRLAAERGTFAQCAPDRHRTAPALLTDPMPAGSGPTRL